MDMLSKSKFIGYKKLVSNPCLNTEMENHHVAVSFAADL